MDFVTLRQCDACHGNISFVKGNCVDPPKLLCTTCGYVVDDNEAFKELEQSNDMFNVIDRCSQRRMLRSWDPRAQWNALCESQHTIEKDDLLRARMHVFNNVDHAKGHELRRKLVVETARTVETISITSACTALKITPRSFTREAMKSGGIVLHSTKQLNVPKRVMSHGITIESIESALLQLPDNLSTQELNTFLRDETRNARYEAVDRVFSTLNKKLVHEGPVVTLLVACFIAWQPVVKRAHIMGTRYTSGPTFSRALRLSV